MLKRPLMIGMWMIMMALIVWAASPSTPTVISPTNNSVFYNNVNLTVGGSTDGDGDNFNYTFWYFMNETNNTLIGNTSTGIQNISNFQNLHHSDWGTHKGGGTPDFKLGTSELNRYQISNPTDTVNMWVDNYKFNSDHFWVYVEETGGSNFKIKVDSTTIFNEASFSLQWARLDVSAFNDGANHQLNFSGDGAGVDATFWFPNSPFKWKAQTCDVNNECSGNTTNQTLNFMNFYRVTQGTNTALNFTFVNESSLEKVNGRINTMTWKFTNTQDTDTSYQTFNFLDANNSYAFGIYPINRTLTSDISVTYSASGYEARSFVVKDNIIGNSTTSKVLYLLPTADGIYTTFQVVDLANSPISGVTVTGEVLSGGAYTEITSGNTGDAGAVTLWVNPISPHRFTFSKTGYTTEVQYLTPTQSAYTKILSSSTGTNQSNYNRGILFNLLPVNTTLNLNTIYNFGFNITSSYWNLSEYGFSLYNSSGDLLTSASGGVTGGGLANQTYDTVLHDRLSMDYFWNINGNVSNGTWIWEVRNITQGDASLKTFFDDLANFNKSGADGFARTLMFIFMFVIIISTLIYFAGDSGYVEYSLMLAVIGLLWLGEYINVIPEIGQKYFITIVVGLTVGAYIITDNIR
jgi:hypothetical protein